MKKLICLFFLLFNILFSKNIYVVFDDSLSMKKDNRDIYANYSLQILTSLLSEHDNLTITRMSDTKDDFRNKTIVNLKDINNELKYFEKNLNAKSQVTPYRSIETIIDYIDKTSSKDEPNWLIVITDGEFEDGKEIPNLERIKNSISKSVQANNLKPIFLLIGTNQNELKKYEEQKGIEIWKEAFGEGEFPKIFKAANQKDIVVRMREIAQLLTSKSSKNSNEIYRIENNRLEFNSLFPLSKIIFLDQKEENNKINNLTKIYVNGSEIKIDKQYKPFKNSGKVNLEANVIHIEGNNNNIVLEFKENITRDIKVLPEVSAKFKVILIDEEGQELKNGFLEIPSENEFKIIGKLFKGETSEMLGYVEGTEVTVNYGNKKITLQYNPENKLYEGKLSIEKGRKSIDGSAEFPGYFYYQSDIYIIDGTAPVPKKIIEPEPPKVEEPIPEPPKPYEIGVEIFPEILDEVTQNNLKNKSFYIIPKINGEFLSEEEIADLDIKLKSELNGKLSSKKMIDSLNCYAWEYKPNTYSGIFNFKNPKGNKNIEVVLENKEKGKSIIQKRVLIVEKIGFWNSYGELILLIFSIFTGLFLIVGYFKKRRFKKTEKIIIEEIEDDFKKPEKRKALKGSFLNTITPFKNDECTVEGLKFIANKGCVGITAESFEKLFKRSSVNKVYMNGDYLSEDDLKTGKNEIYRLYNEDNIEFVFDNSRKKYIYIK